jgi:hypothetical protein
MGLPAQAIAVLACLVASSIVGWVVYVMVERPTMLSLKKWTVA